MYRDPDPDHRSWVEQVAERMASPWSQAVLAPPEDHPVRLSVVVPLAEADTRATACLEALRTSVRVSTECIAVAASFTEGQKAVLGVAGGPPLQFVEAGAGADLCALRNAGLGETRGEFVAFVDPSVRVAPLWDAGLLLPFFAAPDVGLTGPVSGQGGPLQSVPHQEAASSEEMARQAQEWRSGHQGFWIETEALAGFCLVGRRQDLLAVGGWDESVTGSDYADLDLSWRIGRHRGRRLLIVGDTLVYRDGSGGGGERSMDGLEAESRSRFLAKWGEEPVLRARFPQEMTGMDGR